MPPERELTSNIDEVRPIIDTDLHLTESQQDILPYLEEPFGGMIDPDTGGDYLSQLYPCSGHFNTNGTGDFTQLESDSVDTAEDVRRVMEMLGLDGALLTPGQNLALGAVHHDELAAGFAHAYNSWLLDNILDEDDDLTGSLVVAPHVPEEAAHEIRERADESGIKAIMIPSGGVSPPLGDEKYFPIYEAAEEVGLPVAYHAAAPVAIANFPNQWRTTKRYIDMHVPYHPVEQMWHLTTMLTSGVPVRFPDVDFVFQEAGIGWIPYLMRRYDNEYIMGNEDAPLLEKRPSEYVREHFYFTSQPTEGVNEPEYLCNMIRLFDGIDRLMFSTDYPHYDFDYTDALYRSLSYEFDDEEIHRIYGENAVTVFDL